MLPFESLTYRGQVGRLRPLAQAALAQYGLAAAKLDLIQHGQNTTFRVTLPQDEGNSQASDPLGQFLLRIHWPGRHGPGLDTREAVNSELQWLAALRHDTPLAVPAPVVLPGGEFTAVVSREGVPQPRVCSLLRWMAGKRLGGAAQPRHFNKLGQVMAQLHNHAETWTIPANFRRMRWDWDGFFGDTIGFAGYSGAEAWAMLPAAHRSIFEAVSRQAEDMLRELGDSRAVFGLIHADLHPDNVIFLAGEAQPIDFDDCGYGYWIYDMAVALWEYRLRAEYPALRQALLDGYAVYRPVPVKQLPYLDNFFAIRDVSFALWFCGMAQHNPDFRKSLNQELDHMVYSIQQL